MFYSIFFAVFITNTHIFNSLHRKKVLSKCFEKINRNDFYLHNSEKSIIFAPDFKIVNNTQS